MYCLITKGLSILVLGEQKSLTRCIWICLINDELFTFGCCIYVLLLLNMPEMAHDWINKSILFYVTDPSEIIY